MMRDSSSVRLTWSPALGSLDGSSGSLPRGFLRVRCDGCQTEQLLAFRCKTRAACPSCGARRMSDNAARLVDHILPIAPYRQWVLSPPRRVRLAMALHPEVSAAILTAFLRAVFSWQRRRAKRLGYPRARTAAITFIHPQQRVP